MPSDFRWIKDDDRFDVTEDGYKIHTFKIGDIVEYIGNNSPFLKGLTGEVVWNSPRGTNEFSTYWRDSLPVVWEGYGYHGIYPHNCIRIRRIPEWEV